jgi:hypothetical protein
MGCDSRRKESPIAPIPEGKSRLEDFHKSYFFDRDVTTLNRELRTWNEKFIRLADLQGSGEKNQITGTSLNKLLPTLKEAQRSFFKKVGGVWQKNIDRKGGVSLDRDVILERVTITLRESAGRAKPSWSLTAYGRQGKNPSGSIFNLDWDAEKYELVFEGEDDILSSPSNEAIVPTEVPIATMTPYPEVTPVPSPSPLADSVQSENKTKLLQNRIRYQCRFHLNSNGRVEKANCSSMMVFRLGGQDIVLNELTFTPSHGFLASGMIRGPKNIMERWSLLVTNPEHIHTLRRGAN